MKICCIASGSSGNCVYVNYKDKHLLIDAGISRKRILEGLECVGVSVDMLDGVLITHEHEDHIKAVRLLVNKDNVPIYTTEGTWKGIKAANKKDKLNEDNLHIIRADEPFFMENMYITPFKINHDANEPVGYILETVHKRCAFATDIGKYDSYTIRHLSDCDFMYLEANYDKAMLETGPYPYYLKRRIQSSHGHLSNDETGRLLCECMTGKLKYVCLAHLSKENNLPEIAYETVKCAYWEHTGKKQLPFHLYVAKRSEPSETVEF